MKSGLAWDANIPEQSQVHSIFIKWISCSLEYILKISLKEIISDSSSSLSSCIKRLWVCTSIIGAASKQLRTFIMLSRYLYCKLKLYTSIYLKFTLTASIFSNSAQLEVRPILIELNHSTHESREVFGAEEPREIVLRSIRRHIQWIGLWWKPQRIRQIVRSNGYCCEIFSLLKNSFFWYRIKYVERDPGRHTCDALVGIK